MFNFLKKKEKSFEAPPKPDGSNAYAPFQKTRIEDDIASFEVPDFSEDDLNFDLGLGEFMPTNSNFIEPKGLPTDNFAPKMDDNVFNQGIKPSEIEPNASNTPSNYNEFESLSKIPLPANSEANMESKTGKIQDDVPIIQDANISVESVQKSNLAPKPDFQINNNFSWGNESVVTKMDESKVEEPKLKTTKVEATIEPKLDNFADTKLKISSKQEDENSFKPELNDDEELPKFNTQGDINFYSNSIIPQRTIQKSVIKPKVSAKKQKQVNELEPIQSPKQGVFLPKQVMQKMIILSDDTSKKTASAESLKASFVTISNEQDNSVDVLTRTMKSVRDSLMIADTKLFGRGVE